VRYTAYLLSIDSELALPELLPDPSTGAREPDVRIRLGDVSPHGLVDGLQLGPTLWANREQLWFQVPHVARYLIQRGDTIRIDPEPGIDEDSIRLFLLGSAFGALLFQRGYLVLHGNAVRIGDQCMVCLGDSGAGKSTLAAGFLQRGFDVLADDVVPVDSGCLALPGFPRIKLWQDTASRLGIDTTNLRRILPDTEKFNYPLASAAAVPPLPVRWVYLLSSGAVDTIRCEPIRGMERFRPLYENTYRVFFLEGMGLEPEHLQLCGQLAGRIHLARVTRPQEGFQLAPLIDLLLTDMAKNP
jgi:hypothetical protein